MEKAFIDTIFQGWNGYQIALKKAVAPLDAEQLTLRASANVRSVGELTAHVIAVRARWFYLQFGEGGEAFKAFCRWDRSEAKDWNAEELIKGLEATWNGMQEAIAGWTPRDWEQTWPGEDETEPETITRPWVIWHLIEHDLYHGGQISTTLGAYGAPTLEL